MMHTPRQTNDRRSPDRRSFELTGYNDVERRSKNRRAPVDRRNDPTWRFSWLRTSISQLLS